MPTFGFRILPSPPRPAVRLLEAFAALPTANISDNMLRHYGAGARLRPFHRSGKLVGPAFTVKTRPGDNLLTHKAIDMAAPGDVILVDAGGALDHAIIGEIMASHARKRGIAGMIIDGAIRDLDSISASDFPVYACGITHRGPYKDGPGEINVTVSIAGMTVNPGDIIVGDADGVVAIPQVDAERIIALTVVQKNKEEAMLAMIANGTVDRSWVDKLLREKGCALP
ncbi:MAG: RraA family protein [Betaproteobacteria bacterium]|nr:RraA family protein [Betaproteobacteria bacterium]